MHMTGAGNANFHVAAEERPHTPDTNEFGQESVVLHWYNARHDIGGHLRIGHEPNLNRGMTALSCSCMAGDGTALNHNEKFALIAGQNTRGTG